MRELEEYSAVLIDGQVPIVVASRGDFDGHHVGHPGSAGQQVVGDGVDIGLVESVGIDRSRHSGSGFDDEECPARANSGAQQRADEPLEDVFVPFVGREGGDHVLDLLEPNLCQFGTGAVLLRLVHVRVVLLPADPEDAALVTPALALLLDHFAGRKPEDHWNQFELERDKVAEFRERLEALLEPLPDDPFVVCDLSLLVAPDRHEWVEVGTARNEFSRGTEGSCRLGHLPVVLRLDQDVGLIEEIVSIELMALLEEAPELEIRTPRANVGQLVERPGLAGPPEQVLDGALRQGLDQEIHEHLGVDARNVAVRRLRLH